MPRSATGHIGSGLGPGLPDGTISLVLPTEEIAGRDIAEEALARLEGVIRKVGATVTVDPNLPKLFADRTWATQGVYNFVANALKFVREGHPPEIEIAAFQPNGEQRDVVGIVVRDRGPGIPPEMTEEIFGLFRRAVGREVEGSGAGLAIVRAVAKRHGGHAWVQPRDGGGSEFIITFGTRKRQEELTRRAQPQKQSFSSWWIPQGFEFSAARIIRRRRMPGSSRNQAIQGSAAANDENNFIIRQTVEFVSENSLSRRILCVVDAPVTPRTRLPECLGYRAAPSGRHGRCARPQRRRPPALRGRRRRARRAPASTDRWRRRRPPWFPQA